MIELHDQWLRDLVGTRRTGALGHDQTVLKTATWFRARRSHSHMFVHMFKDRKEHAPTYNIYLPVIQLFTLHAHSVYIRDNAHNANHECKPQSVTMNLRMAFVVILLHPLLT